MDSIGDDRSWNVIGQIKKFGRTIFRDYYKSHSQQLTQLMGAKDFFDHYQQQLRRICEQARKRMTDMADTFFTTLADEQLTVEDLSYGKTGVAGLFLKLKNGVFDESILTKRATDCVGQPDKWYKKSHPRHELIH